MALSVEDRMAILDLAARYNHAFDYGDSEAWADTFTPDGVFGGKPHRGTEELRTFAEGKAEVAKRHRHWTSNHVIQGSGDTATHTCYVMITEIGDKPTLFGTGIYRDRLKKLGGEWKFLRRELTAECEK